MKLRKGTIFAAGLILTIIFCAVRSASDTGRELERLRSKVLRLHILAESDSDEDQARKIAVRDALLESGIFDRAANEADAEELARSKMGNIKAIAEKVLRENGSSATVQAYLTDMYFSPRIYGEITMPAGNYRTLRVEIGEAQGHNWWCVMYPPLWDILNKPEKYEVRLALWDMVSGAFDDNKMQNASVSERKLVHNAEKWLFP